METEKFTDFIVNNRKIASIFDFDPSRKLEEEEEEEEEEDEEKIISTWRNSSGTVSLKLEGFTAVLWLVSATNCGMWFLVFGFLVFGFWFFWFFGFLVFGFFGFLGFLVFWFWFFFVLVFFGLVFRGMPNPNLGKHTLA